ncbi:MAG: glycoside hydrolase family 3 protein [Pseudobutyrivibrio sp.]|nr:glycoside hydrolase family 3 protein [Pseudobutyrivibrio sp.]
MKKKSILLLFVTCLCLSFMACGQSASQTDSQTIETETIEGQDNTVPLNNGKEDMDVPDEDGADNTQDKEDIDRAEEIISSMTLDEKIYQLFLVTPEQLTGEDQVLTAGPDTKLALENKPVGGVIYFGENITSASQIKSLLKDMASYAKYPLFLAIDEEGGRVARLGLADIGFPTYPAMAEVGASNDPNQSRQIGQDLGTNLREYGFNLDLAPVADLVTNPENSVIGDRSFGSDPALVGQMVLAQVAGFHDAGFPACLKHFPGHGNTSADSHTGMAASDVDIDTLRARELAPFATGIEAGADMVMTGHISLPNIVGDNTPATVSKTMTTDILRGEMGFEGVIITDSMRMKAVSDLYGPGQASVKAIMAGADIILMPEDLDAAVAAVKEAVESGSISQDRIDQSLQRIINLKLKYGIMK